MTALYTFLESLSAEHIKEFYLRLAQTVLNRYSFENVRIEFIQHNSGITYRVESFNGKPRFLLKIHEPVGTGQKASLEQIRVRMEWLAELAKTSKLVVQTPVENTNGAFVTEVPVLEIDSSVLCSIQNWVEGEHQDGDFTIFQAESAGAMMAVLHQNSSHLISSRMVDLPNYTINNLLDDVKQLHAMVGADIISLAQFTAIERASQRISQTASVLGDSSEVYGPVHGDLHQGNILFFHDQVRPIDFDSLRNSYYLFDLGTTLYHILYQDVEFRNALISGYTSIRKLSIAECQYFDAFVTWSAINNLAFQSTISQQVKSKFFVRNLHQLTDEFCAKIIRDEPFVLM